MSYEGPDMKEEALSFFFGEREYANSVEWDNEWDMYNGFDGILRIVAIANKFGCAYDGLKPSCLAEEYDFNNEGKVSLTYRRFNYFDILLASDLN